MGELLLLDYAGLKCRTRRREFGLAALGRATALAADHGLAARVIFIPALKLTASCAKQCRLQRRTSRIKRS
ncbi:hypothetical protein J2W46_005770 [Paraburkholderia strydomiana]|nr:hypothetical protein [Paraburkholderia strydomiana]